MLIPWVYPPLPFPPHRKILRLRRPPRRPLRPPLPLLPRLPPRPSSSSSSSSSSPSSSSTPSTLTSPISAASFRSLFGNLRSESEAEKQESSPEDFVSLFGNFRSDAESEAHSQEDFASLFGDFRSEADSEVAQQQLRQIIAGEKEEEKEGKEKAERGHRSAHTAVAGSSSSNPHMPIDTTHSGDAMQGQLPRAVDTNFATFAPFAALTSSTRHQVADQLQRQTPRMLEQCKAPFTWHVSEEVSRAERALDRICKDKLESSSNVTPIVDLSSLPILSAGFSSSSNSARSLRTFTISHHISPNDSESHAHINKVVLQELILSPKNPPQVRYLQPKGPQKIW